MAGSWTMPVRSMAGMDRRRLLAVARWPIAQRVARDCSGTWTSAIDGANSAAPSANPSTPPATWVLVSLCLPSARNKIRAATARAAPVITPDAVSVLSILTALLQSIVLGTSSPSRRPARQYMPACRRRDCLLQRPTVPCLAYHFPRYPKALFDLAAFVGAGEVRL